MTEIHEHVSAANGHAPLAPQPDHDAIRTHVRMLHTLAKAAGVDGTLVLTRIDPMKDNVRVERFEIGDDKIMSDAVIGWSTHPNLNLYSSFAIFRKNMPAGARGGEADVCAVLAFVGDLDSDPGKTSIALDDLPLEPPYVIESSSGNFQPVWPLAKALSFSEAKPVAECLGDALRGDKGAKDLCHIWRIPGTLNWPNEVKLKRGRSPLPQLVTVATPWEGDLVEIEDIEEAIEDFEWTPPPAAGEANGHAPCGSGGGETEYTDEAFQDLPDVVQERIAMAAGINEDRSETAASVIWSLFKRNWSDEAVEEVIAAYPNGIGARYTKKGKSLSKDIKRLRKKWDNRPIIDGDTIEGPPPPEELASGSVPPPPPNVSDEIPEHLLKVPGLVGKIMQFILDSAIQPQPVLALGASLVIVGTAAGRLLAGPTLSGTHLYVIELAESGAGKDHAGSMTMVILDAARLGKHIGPSQFISMPSVINFLKRCPLAVCVMDEFGSFLKRINNRKASEFAASISGILRSIWGSSFKPMATPEWAGTPSVTIHAPAVSILGISTPEEFYAALDGADIINGALNRFVLLETFVTPQRQKPSIGSDQVPKEIIDGLNEIYNQVPAQAADKVLIHPRAAISATNPPDFAALAFSPEAELVKDEMDADIWTRGRADRKLRPFLARVVENAIRLATIMAIGDKRMVVEAADMVWARDVMLWSTRRMADGAGLYISDSEPQAIANAIKRVLKGNGKVARSALINTLDHKYRASDLNSTLSLLIQGGNVEEEKIPQAAGKAGRPAIWYTFRG